MSSKTLGILSLAVLVGCGTHDEQAREAHEGAERAAQTRFSFEDVEPGGLPAAWQAGETQGHGTPATWCVRREDTAPSGRNVLSVVETRNSGSTFNLVLSDRSWPADLELAVQLRADSGEEDQGGGLVWRARGPDDYYVTRWNPLENNLRAYKVVGGHRTMLKSATVEADRSKWHELEVAAHGPRVFVSFDGRRLLDYEDATFTSGGRIGLWTKADAATSFDDLEIE